MKYLLKHYMKAAGYVDRARYIQKLTKVDPILFDALTYKNSAKWLGTTLLWMSLLESDYFLKRIRFIRNTHPDYVPDMVLFVPIFNIDLKSTLELLISLDDLSFEATDRPFPDALLHTIIPAIGKGPYSDLFKEISLLEKKVPIELLHPSILGLGLQFCSTPKTIQDLALITRRDITFLANFVCDIAKDKELSNKLISYLDDEDAFLIFMLVIAPENPMSRLQYDEALVSEGLDAVRMAISEYEKDPQQLKSALLDQNG